MRLFPRKQDSTDYQDYLEAEWIKQLRAKYPVVLNKDVWAEIKVKGEK